MTATFFYFSFVLTIDLPHKDRDRDWLTQLYGIESGKFSNFFWDKDKFRKDVFMREYKNICLWVKKWDKYQMGIRGKR